MAIDYFNYKGTRMVEITCSEGTLILTREEFNRARLRTSKHIQISPIIGGRIYYGSMRWPKK